TRGGRPVVCGYPRTHPPNRSQGAAQAAPSFALAQAARLHGWGARVRRLLAVKRRQQTTFRAKRGIPTLASLARCRKIKCQVLEGRADFARLFCFEGARL